MILKKRLEETIHDKFIEALYEGKYHAGERIDPAELANEFSISRTPVVQALKQLANEKVLTVNSGGKFLMLVPTEKMLDDVCNVRCLLEQHAITLHMQDPDLQRFERLKGMVRETKNLMERGDFVNSIINNLEFHKAFVEETGNKCLYEVYLPVLYQYGGIKYSLGNQWNSHRELENWHLKIMDYMIANEEEKAREAAKEHIEMCRLDITQRIRDFYLNREDSHF